MKLKLYSLILILGTYAAEGQIITPTVKANFGTDADLRANFFNNASTTTTDDWYIKTSIAPPGTGVAVIDTTGAGAIIDGYNTNTSSRRLSFYRPMAYMPYTVVNNKLLLDALFYRDFHGDDSTVFASGSNKNGMSPASWSCPVSQSIPDKNDILDVFTHLRRDGTNLTDSLWMFGGISIENTTGNRYFDFELYQTDIVYKRSTRTFTGYGADAGHTAWLFDAAGNVIRAGDIIFSAEYSSSSLTLVEARIWVDKNTTLTITPANFNWGGLFDGATNGATYGYASITPKTAGAFYTGLQCSAGTWAGAFSLVLGDNSVTTTYTDRQFMEFSVNLSKLGLDPATYGVNPCAAPFKRLLIKSRASTSFTAELKDFVMPFKLFDRLTVDAYAGQTYQCKRFFNTYISVNNPSASATYTWSTTNGVIVGSNVGTGIIAGAPGTYKVLMQLNTICPQYATDSVTLVFDSLCPLLNTLAVNLQAKRFDNTVSLYWQVDNNETITQFIVEQSYNSTSFNEAGFVSPTKQTGNASYFFTASLAANENTVIYYRIKAVTASGTVHYSKIVPVNTSNNAGIFYPNPAAGGIFWFEKHMASNETITLLVWNSQGKKVATQKINMVKGENRIKADCIAGYPQGYYLIKLQSSEGITTGKILVTQ